MKKDHLIIDGKMYITTRRAAEIAGYSADYVGQLCRLGKIERRMINRAWYVEKESIVRHSEETFKANHTSFKADDFKEGYDTTIRSPFPLLLAGPEGHVVSHPLPIRYGYEPREREAKRPTARFVASLVLVALLAVAALDAFGYIRTHVPIAFVRSFDASQGTDQAAQAISAGSPADASPDLPNAGLVVVPSAGSQATDIKLANAITNSFSDPVTVKETPDSNSGIITPVFRTVKGHDFMYVLVPVKTGTSSATSAN